MVRSQKTEARGRFRLEALLGFPGKGKEKQDIKLGLASLSSFMGFWAIGMVPRYLALR